MAKKSKALDPHAEREAANYENPIPSREYIQQLLLDADQPLNNQQIYQRLHLEGEEQIEALRPSQLCVRLELAVQETALRQQCKLLLELFFQWWEMACVRLAEQISSSSHVIWHFALL